MDAEDTNVIQTEEQLKWYERGKADNLEDFACLYGLAIGITIGVVLTLIIMSFL